MKVVIYHADAKPLWDAPKDAYKRLFRGFVENAHSFGMDVIHLTTMGHEGWGDEVHRYDLNPQDIMFNREVAFSSFLESAPDDIYVFMEPDARIKKAIPPLKTDVVLLYRDGDGVAITPSFRMSGKSGLPFFKLCFEKMEGKRKDWHGDSEAFAEIHKLMGSPKCGITNFMGLSFEFRKYLDYTKPDAPVVGHWKFKSKENLLAQG